MAPAIYTQRIRWFPLFICCSLILCRILNKLTPEKFDVLKGQLIDSGITSADILKVVTLQLLLSIYFCAHSCSKLTCFSLSAGCHFTYF